MVVGVLRSLRPSLLLSELTWSLVTVVAAAAPRSAVVKAMVASIVNCMLVAPVVSD
jgi:hypothetical protein